MSDQLPSIKRHLAGTVLLLSAAFAASRVTAYRVPDSLAEPLSTIDLRMAGFSGRDNPPLDARVLAQLQPTSYLSRTYSEKDLAADVFVAFYAQQRAGESMHSPRHCLPGSGWEIWDYGSVQVPVAGRAVRINKYAISREGARMLVLYWYQSRERIIASEYMGKLLLARDALFQNSTAAAIVRIIVPDRPGTLEEATRLAVELIPQMQRCFRADRLSAGAIPAPSKVFFLRSSTSKKSVTTRERLWPTGC
jgi:EpsI family protein